MLRDTSMANAKSRSTCSAARANVIWVRTSDTNGSTHLKIHITPVLPMLSTPDDSATHPMLLVASYQKSGLGTPDGGFVPVGTPRPLFSDERREDVLGNCLDLTPGQWRRMRVVRRIRAQILALEAIAVRVLIGVFVEVRHLGSRTPAGDHLDQLLAVKARLVQIGRRAW